MRVRHDTIMEAHFSGIAEIQHPVDIKIRIILKQSRHGYGLKRRAGLHILRYGEVIRLFVCLLLVVITQRCHHLDKSRLYVHHDDTSLLGVVIDETATQRLFGHILNLSVDRGIDVVSVYRSDIRRRRHVDETALVDTTTHLVAVTTSQTGVVSAFKAHPHRIDSVVVVDITYHTQCDVAVRAFPHKPLLGDESIAMSLLENRELLDAVVVVHLKPTGYLHVAFVLAAGLGKLVNILRLRLVFQHLREAVRQPLNVVFENVVRHRHRVEMNVINRDGGSQKRAVFREDVSSRRLHLHDSDVHLASLLHKLFSLSDLQEDDAQHHRHCKCENEHINKQNSPNIVKSGICHLFCPFLLFHNNFLNRLNRFLDAFDTKLFRQFRLFRTRRYLRLYADIFHSFLLKNLSRFYDIQLHVFCNVSI